MMSNQSFVDVALAVSAATVAVPAGIPELDVLLYGRMFVNRIVQQAADNITVVARVDRPPLGNFPGEEEVQVGRKHLGDVAAGTGRCLSGCNVSCSDKA